MSLAARVARLETTQKRVLRCLWCRFALHDVPPLVQKAREASGNVLPTKCWFCGTSFVVPLDKLNDQQREAVSLIYNSHPAKQFTDERVHVAGIWFYLYLQHSEIKRYEKAKREQVQNEQSRQPTWTSHSNSRTRGSLSLIQAKAKRDQEELKDLAYKFREAQMERFKKLAGETRTFSIDQVFERIETEYPVSTYDETIDELVQKLGLDKYSAAASRLRSTLGLCNLHHSDLKRREACELVLWRGPLPETVEEIKFFEQEKQTAIDEARVKSILGEAADRCSESVHTRL